MLSKEEQVKRLESWRLEPKPEEYLVDVGASRPVNLQLYIRGQNTICLPTVLDFLDALNLADNVQRVLYYEIITNKIGQKARPVVTPKWKSKKLKQGPPPQLVGICPRCGGYLLGGATPNCESAKTGRLYYKICADCPYYSELFMKNDKLEEIEGD